MKVVINACYGGFSLSNAGIERYAELAGIPVYKKGEGYYQYYYTADDKIINDRDIERSDPLLVQVVEELGEASWGSCAKLVIEDVPKGTLYRINEYDGRETIKTSYDGFWEVAR